MTWWSITFGVIAVAFLVVGFGLLARAAARMVAHVRLGAPDPHRAAPIGGRLKTLVKEFLGHTRMLKWGWIGVRTGS